MHFQGLLRIRSTAPIIGAINNTALSSPSLTLILDTGNLLLRLASIHQLLLPLHKTALGTSHTIPASPSNTLVVQLNKEIFTYMKLQLSVE